MRGGASLDSLLKIQQSFAVKLHVQRRCSSIGSKYRFEMQHKKLRTPVGYAQRVARTVRMKKCTKENRVRSLAFAACWTFVPVTRVTAQQFEWKERWRNHGLVGTTQSDGNDPITIKAWKCEWRRTNNDVYVMSKKTELGCD